MAFLRPAASEHVSRWCPKCRIRNELGGCAGWSVVPRAETDLDAVRFRGLIPRLSFGSACYGGVPMNRLRLILFLALAWLGPLCGMCNAGHCGGWSVGLNFGFPAYYPYWGCGYPYGYYYPPYPVYAAPAPVVVQQAP